MSKRFRPTTNTASGFRSLIDQSIYRLAGKTTFRHPGFSALQRLFALLLYPVAVVGAIVRPVIWLALVTAFAPSASFTPVISTVVEWAIVLSVLFAYAPPSWVSGFPPVLLDYYGLLQGIRPGWSLSTSVAGWRITVTLSTAIV